MAKKTKKKHKKGNPGRGGAQPGAGRPPIKLTESQLKKFDKLAKRQCKIRTIADVLGIEEHVLRETNKELVARLKQKRAEGRAELHESQWEQRKTPVMSIWLGKQHLEQSDKNETKLSGEVELKPPVIK